MVVDLVRRADLLDMARPHHHDPLGQRHRLDLVMGDVDDRRAHFLMQLLDLGAHVGAKLGVQIGQRLVEQEHLRIAHDRPAHGDALALAARKLRRPPLEQMRDVQDGGRPLDALANGLPGLALHLERERHVAVDVECG